MIYFAQLLPTGAIKIGCTGDVEARMDQLAGHYGVGLVLLAIMPGGRPEERAIHERFSHLRLGRTEQFQPGTDLMAFIGKPLLVDSNPDAVEAVEPIRPAIAVTLRGSTEWKTWIEAGAKFCRTDVAKLIDAALVDYLKARGFNQEAPER